jgi:hypothetical protein
MAFGLALLAQSPDVREGSYLKLFSKSVSILSFKRIQIILV